MTYSVESVNGNGRLNNPTGPAFTGATDALSLERLAGDAVLDHLTWSATTALCDDRQWLEQQAARAEFALSLIAESPHMLPSGDPRRAKAEHVLQELVQSLRASAGAVRAAAIALSAQPDLDSLPNTDPRS